jgi:AcrR family transcriptional regulator
MGRRERLRTEAVQQIKAAGLEQLRSEGAAGLSLRAVARAVGMSSPGLYRYYASRDELLTALITDVYDDLGQALEQARDAAGPALVDRLRSVCLAYYDWADAHRAEFSLVFGAPVPSYSAPPDGSTTAAAHRFGAVFTGLLAEAWAQHGAQVQRAPVLPIRPDARLAVGAVRLPDDPRFLGVSTRLWSRLHGVLALGLYGHLLPHTVDPAGVRTLYEAEVEDALIVLGLARPVA